RYPGRLPRRGGAPGALPRHLLRRDEDLRGLVRSHDRLLEGAVLRNHRALGLHLQGLQLRPRRRGGSARHHPGGGALLRSHPGLGLLPGVRAAVIRVQGLHKRFGTQEVLRGLDLDIATGEIMVVIGRSGGGKSVLLRHMIGLLRPDSGAVLVDGTDITRLRGSALDRVRERYGVVFQGGALFDSMSVWDTVAFPLREKSRRTDTEIRER